MERSRTKGADLDHARLRAVVEGTLPCGPETLQINLGNACNLNCIFCWNHSPLRPAGSSAWQRQRLGPIHLQNVMDSLPALRPSRMLLSGRGEPLLHPQVDELLGVTRRLGVPVSVQTNGVGGPDPEELCALGVDHLLVNISAATAETYAQTHPGKGDLFALVVERLKRFAALSQSGAGPRVTLTAVIQRTNQGDLLPLVDLAARVGARGLFLKGMELVEGLELLMLDITQRRRVLDDLAAVRRRAERLELTLDAGHLEQVLTGQDPGGSFSRDLKGGPCYMGWYYLRVTCDGRVMYCCKDKLVDHLDRRSLYRIWRSPAYHLQRLAGRDGDRSGGLFDAKCRSCSNVVRNREIGRQLGLLAHPGLQAHPIRCSPDIV